MSFSELEEAEQHLADAEEHTADSKLAYDSAAVAAQEAEAAKGLHLERAATGKALVTVLEHVISELEHLHSMQATV